MVIVIKEFLENVMSFGLCDKMCHVRIIFTVTVAAVVSLFCEGK
jgi:hypothetical protein